MTNNQLACLNGSLISESEVTLGYHDAGFVYGATITDFARTYAHRLFRWPDHLRRFRDHCAACFVPLNYSDEQITAWADQLVAHNAQFLAPEEDLALITCATPGPLPRYRSEQPGKDVSPTFLMHTFPLSFGRYRSFWELGAQLQTVGMVPQAEQALVSPGIKHRSRLQWWIAEQRVRRDWPTDPHVIPLLLAEDDCVTETALAAFLIARNGTVIVPPRERILDSISLRITRDLCAELGIPLHEHRLPLAECLTADEAMLTGTAFGLAGVGRINDTALSWPGPITQRLLAGWNALVGLDVKAQILGHSGRDTVDRLE